MAGISYDTRRLQTGVARGERFWWWWVDGFTRRLFVISFFIPFVFRHVTILRVLRFSPTPPSIRSRPTFVNNNGRVVIYYDRVVRRDDKPEWRVSARHNNDPAGALSQKHAANVRSATWGGFCRGNISKRKK